LRGFRICLFLDFLTNITKDIYNYLKRETEREMRLESNISPEDWILIFLYAGPDRETTRPSILGTLMFTKQFFVFVKEIKEDLEGTFKFIPYYYGPYSVFLQRQLDTLSKNGYIEVVENEGRKDFIIAEKGIEKIKNLYGALDKGTKIKIENLRREATQLGYSGVLRYVYSRYPEFTTASKIRGEVFNESW